VRSAVVFQEARMDAISSTYRRRISIFVERGYTVYCSGESGGGGDENEQCEFRVGVKQNLDIQTTVRPPELISDHLLKVILDPT